MKLNPIQQEMYQMQREIMGNNLKMNGNLDVKTLANQGLTNMVQPSGQSTQVFPNLLSQAINQVNRAQKTSNELATRFEQGENVSLADVMIAKNKASVLFEATIQTRNKLVDAYKEVMSMPI